MVGCVVGAQYLIIVASIFPTGQGGGGYVLVAAVDVVHANEINANKLDTQKQISQCLPSEQDKTSILDGVLWPVVGMEYLEHWKGLLMGGCHWRLVSS